MYLFTERVIRLTVISRQHQGIIDSNKKARNNFLPKASKRIRLLTTFGKVPATILATAPP
jgi:hypothetical protein